MSKDHLIKAIKGTLVDICYMVAVLVSIFGAVGVLLAILWLGSLNVWFGIGMIVLVAIGALFVLNLRNVRRKS